jgi:hypothetical protein
VSAALRVGVAARSAPPALITWELPPSRARRIAENLDALRGEPVSDEDRVRALDPIADVIATVRAMLGARTPPLVRLRGVPVDDVDRARPLPHATPRADAFLHAIVCALGRQPMVYGEAAGKMCQDVFPLPGALDKPHAHGAAKIRWHIDGGGYPRDLIPDRMGLLGIVNDTRITTAFASIDAVLEALPAHVVRALEQPLYRYCLPTEQGGVDKSRFTPWLPLVRRSPSGPTFSYMFPYVLPKPDTDAADAVAALERACDEQASRILIERGDLVLWANGPYMHAREAVALAEGSLRWLKRVFGLEVNHHNAHALGPDHVVRADAATLERLTPRYRP